METPIILDVLVVVKLLPTLKHIINVNSPPKKFIMNVPESDARASFSLSFFLFFLGARLLMSFHGNSYPFDHFHSAANQVYIIDRKTPASFNFQGIVFIIIYEFKWVIHCDSTSPDTIWLKL